MGEEFKRKKAAAFRHQQDERYDKFCAPDLLSATREAVLHSEYDAASVGPNEATPAGTSVLLRMEDDGGVGIVSGFTLIGRVNNVDLHTALGDVGGLLVGRIERRSPFGNRFTVRVSETGGYSGGA